MGKEKKTSLLVSLPQTHRHCFLAAAARRGVHSPMDWQGQKLSEMLMQVMLVAFAVGAFGTGYALGSFQTMLLVYAGGVVLTTLVTVPNWPFYNRHPLKWLDPAEAERHPRPKPQPAAPRRRNQ